MVVARTMPAGFIRLRLANRKTGLLVIVEFLVPHLSEINILLQFDTCQGEVVAIIRVCPKLPGGLGDLPSGAGCFARGYAKRPESPSFV